MNPRILKNLSKKASKIIDDGGLMCKSHRVVLGCDEEGFDTQVKVDKKHLQRWYGKPNQRGYFIQLKGTVGYGSMGGYFEEEWSDMDAYSILVDIVLFDFCAQYFMDDKDPPENIKHLKNPSSVFKYARRMIEANKN